MCKKEERISFLQAMFTGIVEEIGIVEDVQRQKNLIILRVRTKKVLKGIKKGESLAVDGVCLTVTNIKKNILFFDIMRETLLQTTLGYLRPRDQVNLERALKAADRLSGHFVTGHVDSVGVIKKRISRPNYTELRISFKKQLRPYLVTKGSICVDGISLTVGKVAKDFFSVYLIPFTKKVTTLGFKKEGDKVNLETDILAKYLFHPGGGVEKG